MNISKYELEFFFWKIEFRYRYGCCWAYE